MVLRVFIFFIFSTLCACSHAIHLVHSSDFSPYSEPSIGKLISAKTEQFTILGFVESTAYVDDAMKELEKKCSHGYINGITTQYSTSHGFFSWTNKILMQGYCFEKS